MKPIIPCPSIEDFFYGSATLGERGQIVIPAEARKECHIQPGDKLLVFRHPMHPHMLMLGKVSEVQAFFQQMSRAIEQAQHHLSEALTTEEE